MSSSVATAASSSHSPSSAGCFPAEISVVEHLDRKLVAVAPHQVVGKVAPVERGNRYLGGTGTQAKKTKDKAKRPGKLSIFQRRVHQIPWTI